MCAHALATHARHPQPLRGAMAGLFSTRASWKPSAARSVRRVATAASPEGVRYHTIRVRTRAQRSGCLPPTAADRPRARAMV